ncbi:hypothetical protein DFH07DRAFT_952768 [Mycena maculata]|uniref:Uncharacterized protein n=1 Tax=Mycena maculata TaxID=230809 RepID=A0AAD7NSW9_9AGAR|nr:hypothetical protein DFH07DRAFT_952768 [Mycena maculata]
MALKAGSGVLQVDGLKTCPDEPMKKASELIAQGPNAGSSVNSTGSSANGNGAQVVNDLTAMVVKKKAAPAQAEASGSGSGSASPTKRNADDEGGAEGKKVRLDKEL